MSKTVAKYQQYAEYKDSGVEWLGEIPSHWQTKKLKFILLDLVRGPFGSALKKEFFLDSGFKVYEQKNCIRNDVTIGNSYISKKMFQELDRFSIRENDLLMSCSGTIGKVVRVPESFEQGIINQALLIMRLNKNIVDLNYFLHVFRSSDIQNQIKDNTQGGAMQNLVATDIFKSISITVPKIEEQTQIANFLDHETAKIDSLIEKQQQLIELLKEKRQAVISHAVTKGLNPVVAMKDSGVEWLGEVPEHWELVPLKYLCTFSGGGTPSKDNLNYWTDGDIPWVSPKDMKTFWIKETQDYITEKAIKESSTNMVEPNSLLMVVRSGILQRTIPIAINKVPVTMNQDMKALKFGNRVLVEYIADLIHGNTSELLLEWSKEGATVESIEHEYLANSIVPVPPIEEQQSITTLVAKKMGVYRELTCKAESQIFLLQERRTALISAAVTGKIDVRNWQNPNNNNEAKMEFSA